MFEKRNEKLLPINKFLIRLVRSIMLGLLLTAMALYMGMVGYHFFENMPWIDAFANAAMILSGMGPLSTLTTHAGKLFAGFYALFSGLAFILIVGIIFTPVIHRCLHKFHLDRNEDSVP